MDTSLTVAVRQRWARAAGLPVGAFSSAGVPVTAAPHGHTAPPGWFGALCVAGQVMVTAPDQARAQALAEVLAASGVGGAEQLREVVATRALPGVVEVLGPAWLSYAAPTTRPSPPLGGWGVSVVVEALELPGQRGDLQGLLGACSAQEVAESGVEEMTGLQVARQSGVVVAAAGWQVWPGQVAHVGVLTAPSARRRGLATAVGAAAVDAALARGLMAQWRARPPASRSLAQRLGLVEVGWQVSWR